MTASEAYLAEIILTRNGTDGLNEELMVGETLTQRKKKIRCEPVVNLNKKLCRCFFSITIR